MKIKKTTIFQFRIIRTRGKTTLTTVLFLCFFMQNSNAQTIPADFFGINYWMPYQYINSGTGIPGGVINNANIQTLVMEVGSSFYRIAGNGYDEKGTAIGTDSTTNDYIAAINAVKAINPNAKFLIQIPFESELISAGNMTVQDAGDLVDNIQGEFLNEVFYYAIGNEWDRYRVSGKKYFASEMATKIKAYAVEMKAADPTILIVAPAVSYFAAVDSAGNAILPRLIGGLNDSLPAEDITGIISGTFTPADGKYYIDVVDYHTYAAGNGGNLSGLDSTNYAAYRQASIYYPNFGFATELSTGNNKLQNLLHKADSINSRTGANKLTYAITEMNINWKNPPLTSPSSTSQYENTPKGLGARSFFASQYWLDMFAAILENGTNANNNKVVCVAPWSIHENSGKGLAFDLGMTKDTAWAAQDPTPLPVYWAYQMMATNFSGTFLPNLYATDSSSYKAFGYKNTAANEIGVIVMNQVEQSPRGTDTTTNTLSINFNSSTPAAANMQFKLAAANNVIGAGGTYTCSIQKETTMLLVFDITTGALKKRQTYSLQDALRTTDTGTMTNITDSTEYNAYSTTLVKSDITIGTNTATTITAGANKIFKATNSIRLNGPYSSGSIGAYKTLRLEIDHTCP